MRHLIAVCSTAILAMVLGSESHGDPGTVSHTTYKEVVNSPTSAKANLELRAYILGVADAIRSEYICDGEDRRKLQDPDSIIDELTLFSRTTWGQYYLEARGVFPTLKFDMRLSDAMLKIFTEHSRCEQYDAKKTQLAK